MSLRRSNYDQENGKITQPGRREKFFNFPSESE
jgi:hypothetical protein